MLDGFTLGSFSPDPGDLPMHDEQLLSAFFSQTLKPQAFNHHNHTRVAWLLLRQFPPVEAERRFCDGLRLLAASLGAAEKYHHTLTIAFVRLIAARLAVMPEAEWAAFRAGNSDLLEQGKALIGRYYSAEWLAQPAARTTFVPPDRERLPC